MTYRLYHIISNISSVLTKSNIFHKIKCMKYSCIKIIELVLVNAITLCRLFGALFLPIVYHLYGINFVALVTIFLFITDAIDGFLARRLKISTFFGCSMDALSDKVLNATLFILLGIEYRYMIPPLIIEILILYISYLTYKNGGNVKSTKTGKIKTIILDVCVILSLILLSIPKLNIDGKVTKYIISNTDFSIIILSSIITISCLIALLDYIKRYKNARFNPKYIKVKKRKKTGKSFKEIITRSFDIEYYSKHKDESIMDQLYK